MNAILSLGAEVFKWVLQTSWQAAVVVCLILLAQIIFRKQLSPGWRYGLWFLLVARLLMPVAPQSAFSIFNLSWLKSPSRALAMAPLGPSTSLKPFAGASKPILIVPEPKLDVPVPLNAKSGSARVVAPPPPAGGREWKISWMGLAFGVWLLGAGVLGIKLLWTSLRFHARLRRGHRIAEGPLVEDLADCLKAFGIKQRVTLIETSLVDSPAVYGLWRKYLLLPASIPDRFSPRELHYIFLHELAHIKRRDLELNWLAVVLQVVHWFNPVLWFAFGRMRADREVATDALALSRASTKENAPYGETIIKLAEWLTGSGAAPALVGIAEDKREIKRRIVMIARAHNRRPWPFISLGLLVFVGALACTDILESVPEKRPPNGRDSLGEAGASQKAEKLITALKQKSRWTFGPKAVLFGDEDGEVSGGLVRSVQIRSYVMSSNELQALGGPATSGLPLPTNAAEVVGWNFDKQLISTDGRSRLLPKAVTPAQAPEFSFVQTEVAGGTAPALKFSAGTCFELSNPFKDPLGNPLLVDYTVVLDVMFPDMKSRWAALWQTDPKNKSDAEWLISTEKGIGITDTYGGRVPEGEWHRLALVVHGSEATFLSYIDGREVQRKYLDVKDEYYNRRLDDDVLSWSDTFSKLRNLQDPTATTAVEKLGLRLENGLRAAAPVGPPPATGPAPFVADSDGEIAMAQAWAAQLPTPELVRLLESKCRWTLGPKALLFADENGENAGGLVHAVQVRNYAMSEDEIARLEGPSLELPRDPGATGTRVAQWNFNGNLESATGGAGLIPRSCAPAAAPEVSFEPLDGAASKIQVARFSRGTYFELDPGFSTADGSGYLLNYTVILDVNFEERPVGWASLWQNDPGNTTDADWFINKKGQLGIRDFYGGTIEDKTWNRLALVVDGKNGTIAHFVNGKKVRSKLMILEDDFGRRGGAEPNLNFMIGLINELSRRQDPSAAELVQVFSRRMHNHPDPEGTYGFVPLAVQITDRARGNGIANASVDYKLGESNEDFFPESVRTDASGRGQVQVRIPVVDRVHLTIRAPGYAPKSLTITGTDILSGASTKVAVTLDRSIKMGGTVIGPDSSPLPHTLVRILVNSPAAEAAVRGWSDLVQTGSDGTWRADLVSGDADQISLALYHSQYQGKALVINRGDPVFEELKNFSANLQLDRKPSNAPMSFQVLREY